MNAPEAAIAGFDVAAVAALLYSHWKHRARTKDVAGRTEPVAPPPQAGMKILNRRRLARAARRR